MKKDFDVFRTNTIQAHQQPPAAAARVTLNDVRADLGRLLQELEVAWDTAAKRTLLPNPRLKMELDRIKQAIRARTINGQSALMQQSTVPEFIAQVRAGIALFRAYAAANESEIMNMAAAGTIVVGSDPQRDILVSHAATRQATVPVAPDRGAISDLLPQLHDAAKLAVQRTPLPNPRIKTELDRLLLAARHLPVPQALAEVRKGIEVFMAYANASDNQIAWMAYASAISMATASPAGQV